MNMENLLPVNTSCMSKDCAPSWGVMALSGLLGGTSLVLFGIFLYTGLPGQINLGFNEQMNLFIDTLLCFHFSFNTVLWFATDFASGYPVLFPRITSAHAF